MLSSRVVEVMGLEVVYFIQCSEWMFQWLEQTSLVSSIILGFEDIEMYKVHFIPSLQPRSSFAMVAGSLLCLSKAGQGR